jgi:hypothetical protein
MIRDADISIYALTVYASLSSRSGLREIIPGRATLASEARCSVRQVARALTELEELGVVRRVRRKSASGRASNGYTLHPNGLIPVEDSQSSTSEVEDSGDAGKGLQRQGFGTEAASAPLLGRDSEAEIDEAAPRKRGTRISDPFVVTSSMRAWAAEQTPLVNVDRCTMRFVNYWRAKSGKDATKLDWERTWQNWLLKDQEDSERRPGAKSTTVDHGREVDRILREKLGGSEQLAVSA